MYWRSWKFVHYAVGTVGAVLCAEVVEVVVEVVPKVVEVVVEVVPKVVDLVLRVVKVVPKAPGGCVEGA